MTGTTTAMKAAAALWIPASPGDIERAITTPRSAARKMPIAARC